MVGLVRKLIEGPLLRRIGRSWAGWRELSLFLLAYLVPVWAFPFVPTQDGPAHLNTVVVCENYADPNTRYHEFFALNTRQVPNITAQWILGLFTTFASPLVAEKLFVSLYVVGFGWATSYFLMSCNPGLVKLAPLPLLFVFNRNFFMGFYSYCISVVLMFCLLGYSIRIAKNIRFYHVAAITVALTLQYFTHLLGFLLAASAMLVLLIAVSTRRYKAGLLGICAAAPGLMLCADYLSYTGFFGPSGAQDVVTHHFEALLDAGFFGTVAHGLDAMTGQLFGPYSGTSAWLGIATLIFFEAVVVCGILSRQRVRRNPAVSIRTWSLIILGALFASAYFVIPDFLGRHGGFLKARLIVLPPILWLGTVPWPRAVVARQVLLNAGRALLVLNLVMVTQEFTKLNKDLIEFTRGVAYAGENHTVFVVAPAKHYSEFDHLDHAAAHYCLKTGNILLDNYQATRMHFPLRFRQHIARGEGDIFTYPNREIVDVVVAWQVTPEVVARIREAYCEVYHAGRLHVFLRPVSDDTSELPNSGRMH